MRDDRGLSFLRTLALCLRVSEYDRKFRVKSLTAYATVNRWQDATSNIFLYAMPRLPRSLQGCRSL